MSTSPSKLLELASDFEEQTTSGLTSVAKKDEKPAVKGKFALPSTHLKVTDSKDHYPLNSEKEGHAALTATKKLNTLPSWFKGSLEELKSAVQKAVKKAFPKL
jgi:hypothetical protein